VAGLAAAALLFAGLWSPGFGGYWSRAQAEELAALPLLGAAWLTCGTRAARARAVGRRAVRRSRALQGAGAGVAVAWPLAWLASDGRAAARRCAWFGGGVLAPWLLAGAWFAAHGALGDFYQAVFVHQGHYAAIIAPPWGSVLRDFGATVGGAAGHPGARRRRLVGLWRGDRARAWWLTAWLAASVAAVLAQRQLAPYHYLLLVPPWP